MPIEGAKGFDYIINGDIAEEIGVEDSRTSVKNTSWNKEK